MIKNYKMAKFININGKFVPFEDERDLITILNGEIDRLNNITDELEKMFDGDLDGFQTINEKGACNDIIEVIQNYKDKLKELKEGNKNENLEKND